MNGIRKTVTGIGGKNRRGFTLVELIIVVIILGILAAVAIPVYIRTVEKVRGEMCINNIRMILSAWQIYNLKNEDWKPVHEFLNVSSVREKLGIDITEKYFGNNADGIPGYYFYFSSNPPPQTYYIWAFRVSGKYKGNDIGIMYNSNNGDSWFGWWFTTAGFPKPED